MVQYPDLNSGCDRCYHRFPDGTFRPSNSITRAELATIASKFDKLSPFVADNFSDITGHWANQYINSAAQKGWVKGYEDGTFRPEQPITRAEFVTLVNNVLGRKVLKENILPDAKTFPDLSPNAWYYEAMMELSTDITMREKTRMTMRFGQSFMKPISICKAQ